VVERPQVLRLIAIVGRAVFLGIVRCNIRLTIVGVPNMANYQNEGDLVP
jgi:hypothetical protein